MDGRKYYAQALLDRYSCIKEFPGTGKPGRPRKPKQMPLQELKYALIVKKECGILVNIEKRIKDIDYFLISTPHTEQQNLTLRQDKNRLTGKTL